MQYLNFIRNNKLSRMDYPVGNYIASNLPIIQEMAAEIRRNFIENGNQVRLVCRGSSGSIIAGIISSIIPILEIIYIPKPGERRHCGSVPEVFYRHEDMVKNVIVDDFIASGETIKIIYDTATSTIKDFKIHGLVVSGWIELDSSFLKDLEIETIIAREG